MLAIIAVAHPPRTSSESRASITEQIRSPPRTNAREGSTEWLAYLPNWCEVGVDDCECLPVVHTAVSLILSVTSPAGWVYTNDAWLEPHALPLGEWKAHGAMTQRRRWVRRIYLNPVVPAMS